MLAHGYVHDRRAHDAAVGRHPSLVDKRARSDYCTLRYIAVNGRPVAVYQSTVFVYRVLARELLRVCWYDTSQVSYKLVKLLLVHAPSIHENPELSSPGSSFFLFFLQVLENHSGYDRQRDEHLQGLCESDHRSSRDSTRYIER